MEDDILEKIFDELEEEADLEEYVKKYPSTKILKKDDDLLDSLEGFF